MIVTVTSWRGIGATTTALLVASALADREPSWLVEADPAGGVLAGRLHLEPAAIGGLERLAFRAESGTDVEAVHAVAHVRGQLRVVTAPADPFRAHSCHAPRTPWVHLLHELDGPVVVDAGRMRAGAASWPLVAMADVVVLVAAPEVCAAVATTEWLLAAGRVSPAEPGLDAAEVHVAVVDQPGGVAFDRAAMVAEFGDRWGGWLPWEPAAIDLVHRGATWSDRRLRRSRLVSAVDELLDAIRQPAGVM